MKKNPSLLRSPNVCLSWAQTPKQSQAQLISATTRAWAENRSLLNVPRLNSFPKVFFPGSSAVNRETKVSSSLFSFSLSFRDLSSDSGGWHEGKWIFAHSVNSHSISFTQLFAKSWSHTRDGAHSFLGVTRKKAGH